MYRCAAALIIAAHFSEKTEYFDTDLTSLWLPFNKNIVELSHLDLLSNLESLWLNDCTNLKKIVRSRASYQTRTPYSARRKDLTGEERRIVQSLASVLGSSIFSTL